MNIFDVDFETIFSEDKEPKKLALNLTLNVRNHGFSLGHYVIYPSLTHRELVFVTKSKFNIYKKRFEELSQLIRLSDKEQKSDVKPKNRKYFVSEDDIKEVVKLRTIISNSREFAIPAKETTISLPYKFADMLHLKEEFVTFVQTDNSEYLIINPADAWMYMPGQAYGHQADDEEESFFSKLRRAI